MTESDATELKIEAAVGSLYSALYQLRSSNQLQREYNTLGVLIDMMSKDRVELRKLGVKL